MAIPRALLDPTNHASGLIVTVEVEKPPERKTASIEFHHDHTSGTRGAAMKWALDRFAKEFPHINVTFVPQPAAFTETFNIKIVAGAQGELALLSGWFAWIWIQGGAFTQINDELAKHDAWDATGMYAQPDVFTLNLRNTRYNGALAAMSLAPDAENRAAPRLRGLAPSGNEVVHLEVGRHVLEPVARGTALEAGDKLLGLRQESGV